MFEFISHQYLPDDVYSKEIATIQLTLDCGAKIRVSYVRKETKNGNKFWTDIQLSANLNGEKKYLHSIEFDSNFLQKDIIAFLEVRSWESKKSTELTGTTLTLSTGPRTATVEFNPQYTQTEMFKADPGECPF